MAASVNPQDNTSESRLSQIVTDAERLFEGDHCYRVYYRSITSELRKFLAPRLPAGVDAADKALDLAHNVMLKLIKGTIQEKWKAEDGKFRFYLKGVLTIACIEYFRGQSRSISSLDTIIDSAVVDKLDDDINRAAHQYMLASATDQMRDTEATDPDCVDFTLVEIILRFPEASNDEWQLKLQQQTGRNWTPAAFRKLKTRMRKRFAEFMLIAAGFPRWGQEIALNNLRDIGLGEIYLRYHNADDEGER